MATNPKFPDPGRPRPRPVPDVREINAIEKKSGLPWILIALVVVAMGVVIVGVFTSRNAKTPQPAAQVAGSAPLEVAGLEMTQAPVGKSFYLQGKIINHGVTPVTSASAEITFYGANGQVAGKITKPITGVDAKGAPVDLTANPIAPGEARIFRVELDAVPDTWNRQTPEVHVAT